MTVSFHLKEDKVWAEAGHEVAAVVTQPDKPKGRSKELVFSPVKQEAVKLGIEVLQPEKARNEEFIEKLRTYNADIFVVVAFGQLLSSLATSYFMLMAARIVVACAHAIFWSIAPPMAVRVVSEDHRHMALGMVVMGESVALIAGLPLGRVIGLALGWRMTFETIDAIYPVVISIP